jgi:hypothetical protein
VSASGQEEPSQLQWLAHAAKHVGEIDHLEEAHAQVS